MLCQFARMFGFLAQRSHTELPEISSSFPMPFTQEMTNEVWERDGVLLVRLGRGSAMQVRPQIDRCAVLFRIVPIAKATQLESEGSWQVASDFQLQAWIHPDSAIGQWLLAKGVDADRSSRAA